MNPFQEFAPVPSALDVGDVRTCACWVRYFFAMTDRDNRMPVVAGSAWDPAGNLAVWREGGRVRCQVLKKTDRDQGDTVLNRLLAGLGRVRYRSHFADCPHAAQHRKSR